MWAGVTLLGVTLLTFVVVFRIPADPAALLAGPRADAQVIANIRHAHRLDRPIWEQYGDFLVRLTHGDLGRSISRDQPVSEAIRERLPNTIGLALTGWVLWLVLGTLLGVAVAARPTPLRENALLAFSIAGVSTPTFWVGILLLYVFVTRLAWFPAGGSGTPRHLVLPALALALSGVAYYSRLAHSSMSEALREDYVRTATAKGMARGRVVYVHALRNALLPLVTIAGADLAALLGGVVFTESVFDWKGMGKLAVEAVNAVDIPLIVGVVLVSASFVVLTNLLVDLLYPVLDPRIRR
jgi:peptide/nickel transport system permease protein